MKVLLVVASKHGGTRGIAEALRDALRRAHADVDLFAPAQAPEPSEYDIVVLGSAIYTGRWMGDMKRYAHAHRDALRARPVYLFSSGPLGEPPFPAEPPADAAVMVELTRAREHVVFAGRLEKGDLDLAERAMAKMVKAPFGDFRPWTDIARWAQSILLQHNIPVVNP